MVLSVQPESPIDFVATAALAIEGFGVAARGFTPERLAWMYGQAFGQPATVLALLDDGRKIGQVALVGQRLRIGDRRVPALALMDVFVLREHRSRAAIGALYAEVERFCAEAGAAWLLAVPNHRAAGVNQHLLAMDTAATLAIRAGVAAPRRSTRLRVSAPAGSLPRADAVAVLERYRPGPGVGLDWAAETLWQRLQDPASAYGLHATEDLLLVSAARTRGRIPYTLLCGFFPRAGSLATVRDVRAVTAAACRLHGRPLFVYVGVNTAVPLPGVALPARLRPSLMIVQARRFAAEPGALRLDRFECLDFDFA